MVIYVHHCLKPGTGYTATSRERNCTSYEPAGGGYETLSFRLSHAPNDHDDLVVTDHHPNDRDDLFVTDDRINDTDDLVVSDDRLNDRDDLVVADDRPNDRDDLVVTDDHSQRL